MYIYCIHIQRVLRIDLSLTTVYWHQIRKHKEFIDVSKASSSHNENIWSHLGNANTSEILFYISKWILVKLPDLI